MAISKLTQLAQEQKSLGKVTPQESLKWLMEKINGLKSIRSIPNSIAKEQFRQTRQFRMGQLYYFYYDPKGKDDLPYYDKFPCVLALEKYGDGFLGLNLHYLPLKYRIAFLGKLMQYATVNEDNEIKRIRITYDILAASKRFREFRPCIKRYLTDHIKSKILAVQPDEWQIAMALPIQQFKGAKPQEVWNDSIEEMKKDQG
jgi:hypothetical protein